jgi:hypothetical protein
MYYDSDNPFLTVQETATCCASSGTTSTTSGMWGGPLWRRHSGRVAHLQDGYWPWSEQRCIRTDAVNETTVRRLNGDARAHGPAPHCPSMEWRDSLKSLPTGRAAANPPRSFMERERYGPAQGLAGLRADQPALRISGGARRLYLRKQARMLHCR